MLSAARKEDEDVDHDDHDHDHDHDDEEEADAEAAMPTLGAPTRLGADGTSSREGQ